jgi:hypothetical protein
MTETAKEPMDEEIARLAYEELVIEHPGYAALPEAMAKALIRLGVNNGIRFSTLTTDKLSVEKLQEHLLPYKKEMVQKIIDEKMQLVTADEFLKLHKESLTAIRENDNLQEQLNTAKKALAESEKMYQKQMDRFLNSEMNESARSHCESQLKLLFPAHKAYDALAAIGGDDE